MTYSNHNWFKTTGSQAVALFVCATMILGVVHAPIEPNWDSIGHLIGRGVGTTLIAIGLASIPAAPHRISTGKWPAWYIWAAWIIAPLVIYITSPSGLNESFRDAQPAVSWFSGNGQCSIEAGFPETPETWQAHLPKGATIPGAHYNTRDGFHLRAECFDYAPTFGSDASSIGTNEWVQLMWEFASLEGIQDLQVSTRQKSLDGRPITMVEGRGYKNIADIKAITLIRLIQDGDRALSLTVIGPAERFPNRAAGEFLERYRWRDG